MSTSHEARFEGIVIGYENWGDVDRLVSFYTPQYGKLEVVAKGVRYEKSKLKGHLELLTHGEFQIAKNRGRGVLTDAVSHETFSQLCTCAQTLYLGGAIADMYNAYLYPHAPDAQLWELLYMMLEDLAELQTVTHEDLRVRLEGFARKFLKYLGYLAESRTVFPSLQSYDALLAHTDIRGPVFMEVERGLAALSSSGV